LSSLWNRLQQKRNESPSTPVTEVAAQRLDDDEDSDPEFTAFLNEKIKESSTEVASQETTIFSLINTYVTTTNRLPKQGDVLKQGSPTRGIAGTGKSTRSRLARGQLSPSLSFFTSLLPK